MSQSFFSRWTKVLALVLGLLAAVLLVVVLMIVVEPTQSSPQAAKKAERADDFVDSIGVNTHFDFLNTAYDERYPTVRDKLVALGVRHARDGAFIRSEDVNDLVYGRYRELARYGVKFDLIVDPQKEGLETINKDKIDFIAQMAGPAIEAFEGSNEPNKSNKPDWVEDTIDYQRNLYHAVKSNPSTRDLPVLSAGLGRPYPNEKPDLESYSDYGNMHSYPGGLQPDNVHLDNYIISATREVTGDKPIMATETGYHTAYQLDDPHAGVSEEAMGKYMPRLFLEYFNRGISRTYAYEFIDTHPDPGFLDREQHFGLLRNDGTEKPAYKSLKNLIALLEDPGPAFDTDSLDYSLGGETENVHRTLLQKRDGSFYLVLWQEVPSYDLDTNRDLPVGSKRVTLTLNQPIDTATTYLPGESATLLDVYSSPQQLTLEVPDHPLVVELSP